MDERIDARGDLCPLPVVKAKRALDAMDEGTLEIIVDNDTAVRNLERFAQARHYEVSHERYATDGYRVSIAKATGHGEDPDGRQLAEDPDGGPDGRRSADGPATGSTEGPDGAAPVPGGGGKVVVVSAEVMGAGDDTLGRTLMKGFIFALTQADTLPTAVLFYNGGVRLTCEGSESLDDLRALSALGVEVLSCGACLAHYGLTERLAVGAVTDMYSIVETQMGAGAVLRP